MVAAGVPRYGLIKNHVFLDGNKRIGIFRKRRRVGICVPGRLGDTSITDTQTGMALGYGRVSFFR